MIPFSHGHPPSVAAKINAFTLISQPILAVPPLVTIVILAADEDVFDRRGKQQDL